MATLDKLHDAILKVLVDQVDVDKPDPVWVQLGLKMLKDRRYEPKRDDSAMEEFRKLLERPHTQPEQLGADEAALMGLGA